MLALAGCVSVPPVTVRTWNTAAHPFYPERDDPQFRVPWLDDTRPLGVAFSGGGTRAAAATLGQLRSLDCLGWMRSVGYVSAVSGGSWAAVPYIYLPAGKDEKIFLGRYVPPERLGNKQLAQAPRGSFTRAINHAWPVWMSLGEIARLRGDESFSAAIGRIFLRPFGLGDRQRFFGSHSEALAHTLGANDGSLDADDFFLPRRGRPYLIVGATLVGEPHGDRWKFFPAELTPLYSGILREFQDPRHHGGMLGGGFVESLAYDSQAPEPHGSQPARVAATRTVAIGRGRYRFTLADVIGASGAAPQATVLRHSVDMIGFPEFRQWPIAGGQRAHEAFFGDGGHIDNIGLLPLLARRVPKILVFINTASPFDANPELDPASEATLYGDLIHYFRYPVREDSPHPPREEAERSGENFADVEPDDPPRVVIGSGEQELAKLVETYRNARRERRPLVHCGNYTIVKNERFGVEPYDASICWVYLDRTSGWVDRLDVRHNPKLGRVLSQRRRFPHYRTFFGRGLDVLRLRPADVNAASNLTAWSVISESSTIGKALGFGIPDVTQCMAAPPGTAEAR